MSNARSQQRPDLLGLCPDELGEFLQALGEPPYRARQLFAWLHRGASFEEMTDLPAPLRRRLAELACAGTLTLAARQTAPDGATKFGFHTADGHLIETVLIPHANRNTLCLSSQIGCAFACQFCATGQQGLIRSLRPGEIVEQAIRVEQDCGRRQAPAQRSVRLRNIVFMGMGEPLANYDGVLKAVRLLNSPHGLAIGARHIAISTCGLPAQIRRLAEEGLQVALAVSLHAATDSVRTQLLPINRRHPIAEVMAAARHFVQKTGRKLAIQYVVIPDLNDTPDQADRLTALLRGLPAMVNLIPRNPVDESARPDPSAALRFARLLRVHGLEVVVRRSRGGEVLGACGQLASRQAKEKAGRRSRPARKHRQTGRSA
jgi:23S rRNA (adenine2503-C2)-methyltransferase